MEVIVVDDILKLKQLIDFGIPITILARECHCSPASIQNYLIGKSIPSGTKQIAMKDGLNHILNTVIQIIRE
jgi:hypothetical protein